MKICWPAIANVVFWSAFCITVWDLFETICQAGDTPYRLHHGWWALLLIALCWLYVNWDFYVRLARRILGIAYKE